ncbi:MAG: IS1634 family transposase [Proteobacteria bacterium]|nr:IS1634 family transposase [Pseudomonadota bacterium]
MFIRRTTTQRGSFGQTYYTCRLVENERVEGKVKQRTLLNLGRHFDVPQEQWKDLTARIKQHLQAQEDIFGIELSAPLETLALRYAAQIIDSQSVDIQAGGGFSSVELDSIQIRHPRTVGVENIALHAVQQLELDSKLRALGFNQHQVAAALGNIVARMAAPASERASHQWLQAPSGLGELLAYDYEGMRLERLYQASDLLYKHRQSLQAHLYKHEQSLFGFEETISLYDLTNTFFEGTAGANPLAKRGRSKEKRSDCPLVTLGLVLDGSGFVRHSEIFSGNAVEAHTLEGMLSGLGARPGTTVVLDAGIASEDNIQWLIAHGYRYLVVSRERKREFDKASSVTVKQQAGASVNVQRVVDSDTGEVRLYCHSELREKKEQAIHDRFAERFETALQDLANGLYKKGCTKVYEKVVERIGRLKEKYARVAQHYEIKVIKDEKSDRAIAIDWVQKKKPHTQATHPGIYCLRTDIDDWNEKTLWKTYTMLTDLESVFRSLKSELGLRPIYHHTQERVSGHIFITLIAYHLVHTLRTQLKSKGIHDSWKTLRSKMQNQQRVTVTLHCEDGQVVHLRKSTRAEPAQKQIYDALGISSQAGRSQKTFIKK